MSTSTGALTSGLSSVIERQMRNWEIGRRQRMDAPTPAPRSVADYITISRQVASGGREVAGLVADRIGWPLFDREILDLMANHDDIRKRVYASMDERDHSWLEESLRAFMDPAFARNDFFHRLSETVLSIARQANAVFLGRGAEFILPRNTGFRVRIVAPLNERIEHFAARRGLMVAAAQQEVHRLDRERQDYIHRYFKAEESDPLRADLLINMSRFSAVDAAELILKAHGQVAARA